MRKAWIAAALSFTTIAGGHFYNRRPYAAVLFLFFLVALQSLADVIVPVLVPLFQVPDATGVFRWMMLSKSTFLVLVAIASACLAFLDARRMRAKESEDLETLSSIAGTLMGLGFAVMTLSALITVLRFSAG